MPSPFYNAIKGTTAGAAGTGAFTPNAAAAGFRAWASVPSDWIGLVRFEDGASWELSFCYWNGTTLSRSATQLFDSSSGSAISLTAAATAALIVDASEVMSHLGTTPWRGWFPVIGSATPTSIGIAAPTATGTAAGTTPATTNYWTEQPGDQFTSATTINAQAGRSGTGTIGFSSSTAGRGGWEMTFRFGASALPTGPRLMAGMLGSSFVGSTLEPSAFAVSLAAFAKDSTDTNIQLLVNASSSGAGTKTDTGIPFAANGWYEGSIWAEPGSTKVFALLVRLDTGDIWFGSTTTDVPTAGAGMHPEVLGGLNGTNTGTAIVLKVGAVAVRTGQ